MTAINQIQRIKLSEIDPPAWNSRLPKSGAALKEEGKKLESLRLSLLADGQVTPVEVFLKDDGRYERISGGRRCAAATAAGWDHIQAVVLPKIDAKVARRRNAIENLVREDLTTYERAKVAADFRADGYTTKEIAELMPERGMSAQHVANLSRAFVNLPAPVLKDWETGHPAATVDQLVIIANREKFKTPEAQCEAWDAHCREVAKKEGRADKGTKRGAKGKDGKGGSGFSIKQKHIRALIHSFNARSIEMPVAKDDAKKWGRSLIYFALGQTDKLPDFIVMDDPVDVKDEEDDAE